MTRYSGKGPHAVEGLQSYRYPSAYGGWIRIGATSDEDAIREANRSLSQRGATMDRLQVWDGAAFVPVVAAA